MDVSDVAALLV